jgi:signal transduction histidine kinase
MLYEFIAVHRDDIIARTRDRVRRRQWPSISSHELEYGVPLFLEQLCETLRVEATAAPGSDEAIGSIAARHGAELLAGGFSVSQVVHDYGDICQVITQIALEQHAPITVDEFQTLNRCLDTAIAEAVTEHTRLTILKRSDDEVERLGRSAHDLRDQLNAALLAFHALKRGPVTVNGSTGAVLGRSLTGMLALVDRSLSEVRIAAVQQRREVVPVTTFVDDIAATGILHAEYRGIQFTVTPVDPSLAVRADPHVLASAVMNLLHNAFKYTRPGGAVTLRAHADGLHLVVEIEDECGGIPDSEADLFEAFGERHGADRSGLGLGLSIARQAARAHGGDITVRNMPGRGCIFALDVPLAAAVAPVAEMT